MDMATAWEKQSPMPYRKVTKKDGEQEAEKEPTPPPPPPPVEALMEEASAVAMVETVEVRSCVVVIEVCKECCSLV